VTARCWRDGKEFTVRLAATPLGVVVDERSARAALRAWRRQSMPVQRGRALAALPGTRLEVESLARLVPCTSVLVGSRASEQNLAELARADKLRHFRLLHLATHGEFNLYRPEETALLLARDRLPTRLEEQLSSALLGRRPALGRLTVRTVLESWKLNADLVVLSACESGLGQMTSGEGMLGFAQALLSRGCRCVVLSRWKVDDTATALLMVRFYENLLGKRKGLTQGMPRAEALAEAKKWLRQLPRKQAGELTARLNGGVLRGSEGDERPVVKGKPVLLPQGDRPFAQPFYWAAFVLIGDPT
jgi:CHAT domain-containing protein